MSDVTVKQLAEVVGKPAEVLLEQLNEAGLIKASVDDMVNDDEKMQLLDFLRRSHGRTAEKATGKITLKRRSISELKVGATTQGGRGAAKGGKTVSVEFRKKRTYVRRSAIVEQEEQRKRALDEENERQEAMEREVEEKRKAVEEAARLIEEKRLAEEEAARLAEEKRKADEEQMRVDEEKRKVEAATKKDGEAEKVIPEAKDNKKPKKAKKPKSVDELGLSDDLKNKGRYGREELHVDSAKSGRRKKSKPRISVAPKAVETKHGFEKPTVPVIRDVKIPESISVSDLAQKMAIKAAEVIKALMKLGIMATINQVIDQDTATLVVEEMGHTAVPIQAEDDDALIMEVTQQGEAVLRPPVVTVMGHVDHGKTSLLDCIRKSKVTAGEAGGITQHIGAYHVKTDKSLITFLDTPGHAAFTAMRARGAKVTDIVILVVAADDGVMPQTVEAIQHAKAANVPIIVAVNKIDKPDADPDRVKQELSKYEVIPEGWGGDVMFVNVSALKGEGIDDLLESILLLSEMLELRAIAEGAATGVVIESSLDKGRGPVATVLVQSGRLSKGDMVLSGKEFGRVRAMFDENGESIESVGPSMPAQILGLSGTPNVGDDIIAAVDERRAREIAELRERRFREVQLASRQATKLEDAFSQIQQDKLGMVTLIVKADVQGSAEALRDTLEKLSTDEVKVNIVGSSVGGISESDVHLAMASNARLIAFNVRAETSAKRLMQDSAIKINYYSVIYDVIDDVRKIMSGLLSPEVRENFIGLAEVRDVFKSSKFGAVAGSLVVDGVVRRNAPIRILRDNVVIYEGELESLRRFKDDVNEVRAGTECGIAVKNYNDVKPGDHIEVYERVEVERTL